MPGTAEYSKYFRRMIMKNRKKLLVEIIAGGIIAAIYAVITILLAPISYGPVQVRIAEGLNVMPLYLASGVPGLTVGCFIANIFGGYGLPDIIFGTLATLLASLSVGFIRKTGNRTLRYILTVLSVTLFNAVIVGAELSMLEGIPFFMVAAEVGLGELVSMLTAGTVIMLVMDRIKGKLNDLEE